MPPKKQTTKKKAEKPTTVGKKELAHDEKEEQRTPITFVDTVRDEDEATDFEFPTITEEATEGGKEKFYESVGRRKEAVARIRLMTRKSTDTAPDDAALMTINDEDYREYFTDATLQDRVEQPLRRLKSLSRFKVSARVSGGGISGQADAIRHGISRSLEQFDANFRKKLKKAGFLTRDSRIKERRKPGLKKARKAPRWSKR